MKKIIVFFKDSLKAFIGSLAILGVYGFIIILSLKLDNLIPNEILSLILKDYIAIFILSFAMSLFYVKFKKIVNDKEKDVVEKTKNIVSTAWLITAIASILICITTEIFEGLLLLISLSILYGFALLIVYLIDRKSINQINKKIKETKKN